MYRLLFGEHLGFLPNTWKALFQVPPVECSRETESPMFGVGN
jgi:hypothetical protein